MEQKSAQTAGRSVGRSVASAAAGFAAVLRSIDRKERGGARLRSASKILNMHSRGEVRININHQPKDKPVSLRKHPSPIGLRSIGRSTTLC